MNYSHPRQELQPATLRGVAKFMCKIGIWNVQNVMIRSSNTRMARLPLAANDTDVISANTVTRQIRRLMATVPRYARKPFAIMWMA